MSDPISPNTLMTSIRDQVEMLNSIIDQCAETASVFQIDHYENGTVPELIETTPVHGAAAIEATKSAYREFSRHKLQHPSNVMRLPGILSVNTKLDVAIKLVNAKKSELKALMQKDYEKPRDRNAYCRKHFPGRMMLQVYRHIHYAERPVVKATFTWDPFTRSTKKQTRAQAIDLLNQREKWVSQHSDVNARKALEIAQKQVYASSDNTMFAIVKPRAPCPRVVLYFSEKDKDDNLSAPANLPIVVPYSPKMEISALPDLVTTSNKRSTRSNQKTLQSVYMPLKLYQVM